MTTAKADEEIMNKNTKKDTISKADLKEAILSLENKLIEERNERRKTDESIHQMQTRKYYALKKELENHSVSQTFDIEHIHNFLTQNIIDTGKLVTRVSNLETRLQTIVEKLIIKYDSEE